jgi:hypothetical protein
LVIQRGNENEPWVFSDLEALPDQDAVDRIVSQIMSLPADRVLDADLDRELTGLAEPSYTIELDISNGGMFWLYVGNVTITGSSYYAQPASQTPMVVDKFRLDPVINLIESPPVQAAPTAGLED